MIANESPVIANSLWAATAPDPVGFTPSQGTSNVDVAIVGAGFTGLSAAIHLAHQGASVAVLDAHTPGWGASGRNGGQVNPGLIENPDVVKAQYGDVQGDAAVRASGSAGQLVFDLIDRYDIDCDARQVGWVQAAHSAKGLRDLENKRRAWADVGVNLQPLSRSEVGIALGSDAYVGGLRDPRGGNLHPLKYALGLANTARHLGAKIYGHSPVVHTDIAPDRVTVRTPDGQVSAGKLLICTNGYSDKMMPDVAKSVVPVRSVQVATEQLPENIANTILPGGHSVSDTRPLLLYFRKSPDGRFIMGGRGAYSVRSTERAMQALRGSSVALYPQLRDVRWTYAWGGYVAATPDHFPRLMQIAPNAVAGLGYNGRGVAMATCMGRVLANWAIGERNLDFPMGPPKPIALHRFARLGVAAEVFKRRFQERFGL